MLASLFFFSWLISGFGMFGIGVAESEILGSEIPLLQVVSMMA